MPLNATGLAVSDQLVVVIAALLINAALGGPRSLYLVLRLDLFSRLLAQGVRTLERKLNRDKRPAEQRRVRGTVLLTLLLMACLLAGLATEFFFRAFHYGMVLEILLVSCLIGFRGPLDRAFVIAKRVDDGELDDARKALAGTAWRNAPVLDEHGLSRAAVETLAVSFAYRTVATVMWYVVLGVPGLLASRMLVMLHEILAQNDTQRHSFGLASHKASEWLMAIPCLFAGLFLLAACAFSPTARPAKALAALRVWLQKGGFEGLLYLPLAVMAEGANVALGGPASVYAGGEWIGGGNVKPMAPDVRRALYIYLLAGVLFLIGLSLLVA